MSTFFISNREARVVALDWEHPKNEQGFHVPLLPRGSYTEEEIQDFLEDGTLQSREELETWYMPDISDVPEDKLGVAAYETTTEGTPISPVFPNTREGKINLVRYVTEHETVFANVQTDGEAWAGILFNEAALAMVDPSTDSVRIS
ncbi:MAG: hypothetical protein JWN38_775 [Candidatus Saccharibacteria bacterium]|nr:hypothetical protein [Candidatus Saccharibacteria bacterium]